jgi:hypothetical protein
MDTDEPKSGYQRELYTEQARRDRFKRIAEKRTNRLLNEIRLLGNTGNKTLYQYDQGDVDKIFATIEKKLGEVRTKFKTSKKDKPFTLD